MDGEVIGVEGVATQGMRGKVIKDSGLSVGCVEEGVLVAGCHHGVGCDGSDHIVKEANGVGGGVCDMDVSRGSGVKRLTHDNDGLSETNGVVHGGPRTLGEGHGHLVNPDTVAARVDGNVFLIGKLELMGALRHGIAGTGPIHFARELELQCSIDVEFEFVVVGLRGNFVVEPDAVGHGEVVGEGDFRSLVVGEAGIGAGGIKALLALTIGDAPGIGALCPAGEVVDHTLESLGIGQTHRQQGGVAQHVHLCIEAGHQRNDNIERHVGIDGQLVMSGGAGTYGQGQRGSVGSGNGSLPDGAMQTDRGGGQGHVSLVGKLHIEIIGIGG